MRKIFLIVIVVIQGCSLLKHSPLSLDGSTYVSNLGPMVGNSTITFIDSTFVYKERGGLFEGVGKWEFADNGKLLIMKCLINAPNTDLTLKQSRFFNLKIKGRNKLVDNNEVYIRKK